MRTRKIVYSVIIIFTLASLLTVTTLSWFAGRNHRDIDITQGSVILQYFHCGDGTPENPFVITRPIHYYHLVGLYQKVDEFANSDYCFQLGYDIDGDGDLEVYNYDDNGVFVSNSPYSTSLNMNSMELLPIGTSEVPFNGTFDGQGLTVTNLNIVGVGTIDGDTYRTTDVGIFGYVDEDASIHDTYYTNVSIDVSGITTFTPTENEHEDHQGTIYVGYLAGHIYSASSVSNIFMNNCNISGSNTITKTINNWGYYGRCQDAATLTDFVIEKLGGSLTGWGSSISMDSLYNRLTSMKSSNLMRTNNSYVYDETHTKLIDGRTVVTTTLSDTAYTYSNGLAGSFIMPSTTTDYIYLHGGKTITEVEEYYTGNHLTGYTIKYGDRYLTNDGTNLSSSTQLTDNAIWNFSNFTNSGETTIYKTINGRTYYLRYNNTSLSISTTSSTWDMESYSGGYRLSYERRQIFTTRTYYLRYNNGWTVSTTSQTLDIDSINIDEIASRTVRTYVDYSGSNNNTFLPLAVNDDNTAADINTGYITSGSNDRTTSGTYPEKSGDIRVSRYTIDNINGSYSSSTLSTVYSINASGTRITVPNNYSTTYTSAREKFLEILQSDRSYVYGLHFMSGEISMDNIVTAPTAKVLGVEYTNYQLPANSINFYVRKRGSINFFAGTYFTNNNSFFSLHHIERDEETHEILSIKEIVEIYSDGNPRNPYIYKYSDNTYSEPLTQGYSSVFKTSQIKINSLTSKAIYYFEMPVNKGEYALGSVEGGTGAYLLYLDIAATGNTDIGEGDVTDFGSVEYRSTPDTVDTTICLISYEQVSGNEIDVTTSYANNVYTVNITSVQPTTVIITILSNDYSVRINGTLYSQAGSHVIDL